jgi:hypothetical protein
MPSSIVSSTTPTGSNSPARACASGNPHDTAPTITPTSTIPLTSPPNANIINMTRGNAQPRWPTSRRNPGRLQIGTGGRLQIGMHGRLRRYPQCVSIGSGNSSLYRRSSLSRSATSSSWASRLRRDLAFANARRLSPFANAMAVTSCRAPLVVTILIEKCYT